MNQSMHFSFLSSSLAIKINQYRTENSFSEFTWLNRLAHVAQNYNSRRCDVATYSKNLTADFPIPLYSEHFTVTKWRNLANDIYSWWTQPDHPVRGRLHEVICKYIAIDVYGTPSHVRATILFSARSPTVYPSLPDARREQGKAGQPILETVERNANSPLLMLRASKRVKNQNGTRAAVRYYRPKHVTAGGLTWPKGIDSDRLYACKDVRDNAAETGEQAGKVQSLREDVHGSHDKSQEGKARSKQLTINEGHPPVSHSSDKAMVKGSGEMQWDGKRHDVHNKVIKIDSEDAGQEKLKPIHDGVKVIVKGTCKPRNEGEGKTSDGMNFKKKDTFGPETTKNTKKNGMRGSFKADTSGTDSWRNRMLGCDLLKWINFSRYKRKMRWLWTSPKLVGTAKYYAEVMEKEGRLVSPGGEYSFTVFRVPANGGDLSERLRKKLKGSEEWGRLMETRVIVNGAGWVEVGKEWAWVCLMFGMERLSKKEKAAKRKKKKTVKKVAKFVASEHDLLF